MAVAREIQVAIGTEGGKHLVARRIDGCPEVLHATQSGRCDAHAPDVHSAHSPRHVRHEVEPLSVGRDSRMGVA